MTKRTALGAVAVLSLGLILGAVIVSGFGGFTFSFAEASGPKFNSQPLFTPSPEVANMNEAFSRVAEIVTPQVVFINVKSKPKETQQFFPFSQQPQDEPVEGSGSGIILTSDGYILTNNHVVEGATADGIKVILSDSREYEAKLVGTDKNTDIAVIKIDEKNLSAASLGNSDNVRVGEWVLAVGNPLGLTSTVTAGIVSAISRNVKLNMDSYAIENFIQTDAVVNPGNSGGALVDLNGQVIGVNTAIATGGGMFNRSYIGYSFAVPINLAKTVAQGIIKYGKYVRGFIGVSISTLDAKKAKGIGLESIKGVFVESVQADGAGAAAGIEAGDVILEVEGKSITNASELQARVGMHQPGETIEVKVFHRGETITKKVTLKGREGEELLAADKDSKKDDKSAKSKSTANSATFDKAGFTVKNLDADAKKEFKRETGVLVTDVKRFGQAFENNLRPNVVIFEVRQGSKVMEVNSVDDLNGILGKLKANEAVLLRIQADNGNTAFVPLEGPAE